MRAKKDAERQGEMKYEQLDIFSFMQPRQAEEPPILLSKGQEVYLVNKGDVIKCTVCDNENSWICGENNRGYRLVTEVQLINVNSKMRKIEIIFKAKKAHLPLGENIIFSKDIDSLDLQYFMRLCRI